MSKDISPNRLWDLAPKFEKYLRESGTMALPPWQQEIRDYVTTAKKPTLFAQNNTCPMGQAKRARALDRSLRSLR